MSAQAVKSMLDEYGDDNKVKIYRAILRTRNERRKVLEEKMVKRTRDKREKDDDFKWKLEYFHKC